MKRLPPQIVWILVWQLALTLAFAAVAGAVSGLQALISALLGGGIAVLANTVFAWQAMAVQTPVDARKVYRTQCRAEVLKCCVTVFLFGLTFAKYREVSGSAVLITYLATYAVFWLALLRKE